MASQFLAFNQALYEEAAQYAAQSDLHDESNLRGENEEDQTIQQLRKVARSKQPIDEPTTSGRSPQEGGQSSLKFSSLKNRDNEQSESRTSGDKAAWKKKQLDMWISADSKGDVEDKPDATENLDQKALTSVARSRASALRDFRRVNKHDAASRLSLSHQLHRQWRTCVTFVDRNLPILNPNTQGKIAWDLFIMVFVLFCAVTVPLEISFGLPETDNILNILNWSINLIFAVDICVNFRTAFIDSQGYLIRDSGPIATNYMKFWLPIDLFAAIPYDLLAIAFGFGGGGVQTTILQFLKTPRLLRLGRLIRILDRVKNVNWLKVAILIVAMIGASHWLACIWYMMYRFCTFPEGKAVSDWGFYIASEDGSLPAYYLNAYYQSFLLIVGNYQVPSNNAERVFFTIVGILGTCFYAAAVGQMSVVIANMSIVSLRHKQKRDMTMDVLRYKGVSEEDQQRVEGYFDYVTQYSHPTNEGMQFLYELPKALYQEIAGLLFKQALSRMPFFKDVEESFLSAVSVKMKIVTYTPKEVIFMAGDLGHDMYMIRKGSVGVVGRHCELLSLLSTGDHFGEIAALTQQRRTAKCVALSHCDLCVLHSNDLRAVMRDFPASARSLELVLASRMEQLKVAGWAGFLDEDESYEEEEEAAGKESSESSYSSSIDHKQGGGRGGRGAYRGGTMAPVLEGDEEEEEEEEDGSMSAVSSVGADQGINHDSSVRSPHNGAGGSVDEAGSDCPSSVLSFSTPAAKWNPIPVLPSQADEQVPSMRGNEEGAMSHESDDLDETLTMLRELSQKRARGGGSSSNAGGEGSQVEGGVSLRSRAVIDARPLGEGVEEESPSYELQPQPPMHPQPPTNSSSGIGSMGRRRAVPVLMSLTPEASLAASPLVHHHNLSLATIQETNTSNESEQKRVSNRKDPHLPPIGAIEDVSGSNRSNLSNLSQEPLPLRKGIKKQSSLSKPAPPPSSSSAYDPKHFKEVLALDSSAVGAGAEEDKGAGAAPSLTQDWGVPRKPAGRRNSVLMADVQPTGSERSHAASSEANSSVRGVPAGAAAAGGGGSFRRRASTIATDPTNEQLGGGGTGGGSGRSVESGAIRDRGDVSLLIEAAVKEALARASQSHSAEILILRSTIEKQARAMKEQRDLSLAAAVTRRRIHRGVLSLAALVEKLGFKIDDMEGRMIETNKQLARIEEDQGEARMLKELRMAGGGGGILGTSLIKSNSMARPMGDEGGFLGRSQGSGMIPRLTSSPSMARSGGSFSQTNRSAGSQVAMQGLNRPHGGFKKSSLAPPAAGGLHGGSFSTATPPLAWASMGQGSFASPSLQRFNSRRSIGRDIGHSLLADSHEEEQGIRNGRASPHSALPPIDKNN